VVIGGETRRGRLYHLKKWKVSMEVDVKMTSGEESVEAIPCSPCCIAAGCSPVKQIQNV